MTSTKNWTINRTFISVLFQLICFFYGFEGLTAEPGFPESPLSPRSPGRPGNPRGPYEGFAKNFKDIKSGNTDSFMNVFPKDECFSFH